MKSVFTGAVVIRADASTDIGTGHVMRCVTLAEALRSIGVNSVFLCRNLEGNLIDFVRERGHRVELLNTPSSKPTIDPSVPHSHWLGCGWELDARASIDAIKKIFGNRKVDWVVIDHYALDAKWEIAINDVTKRLMIIDDLADRHHKAHMLLDQNAGRNSSDYDTFLNKDCKKFIGPKFALLRPDFSALRNKSLTKRKLKSDKKSLLISLGGIDKDNATGKILEALATIAPVTDAKITVILGANSPWKEQVKALAEFMPVETNVKINVADMANHMLEADICIGAAGSTAWERCALGLPTLQIVLADNQETPAQTLSRIGASIALPNPSRSEFVKELENALEKLADQEFYMQMSARAFEVTEGKGADLIAKMLATENYQNAH